MSWLDAFLSAYNVVQSDGTALPQRTTIDFIGATVADNPTTGVTEVTAGGGGSFDGTFTPATNHTIKITPSAGSQTQLEITNGATTAVGIASQVYIHGADGPTGADGSGVIILGGGSDGDAGDLLIRGGTGTGGAATAGAVTIDAGNANSGAAEGAVTIGASSASGVGIGRAGRAVAVAGDVTITGVGITWGPSVTTAGLSQTQSASGAGAAMTLTPQRGQTAGTHASGPLNVELGPVVAGVTAKFSLLASSTSFFDVLQPSAGFTSIRAPSLGIQDDNIHPVALGGTTFTVETLSGVTLSAYGGLLDFQSNARQSRFKAGATGIALFGGTERAQPSRAGQLTDNSGGTGGGSTIAAIGGAVDPTAALKVDTANAIATLAARLNLLEGKISGAGTGIGVTA